MRSGCAPSVCEAAARPILPWLALAIGLAAIGHLAREAAQLARHRRWPAFGWRMALAAILLGAGYTILSEWLNVEIRRTWSYTAAMPVLPFLGTGLTPLLQWLVVPSLAFAITAQRYGRATRGLR